MILVVVLEMMLLLNFLADDLKMYVTVNNIKDCQVLQLCLNTLYDWTIKWQLNISIPKCIVLRLGNRNVSFTYNFNNLALPNVSVVRDLGVLIDDDLKFSSHIEAMVTKAHQRASLILRCFKVQGSCPVIQSFCYICETNS